MPTNNCGGIGMALVPRKMFDKTPGAILQPQPPPCDKLVKRGSVALTGTANKGNVGLVLGAFIEVLCVF